MRFLLISLLCALSLTVQAQTVKLLVQSSPLAGFQYHAGATVWNDLKVGDQLTLIREPGNAHDARAVRVEWRGVQLAALGIDVQRANGARDGLECQFEEQAIFHRTARQAHPPAFHCVGREQPCRDLLDTIRLVARRGVRDGHWRRGHPVAGCTFLPGEIVLRISCFRQTLGPGGVSRMAARRYSLQ